MMFYQISIVTSYSEESLNYQHRFMLKLMFNNLIFLKKQNFYLKGAFELL
jgi:hypothetical protein